eukprot:TRINITY_DN4135_c0_g1_i1.p1 TRINITY_DN4135_c0_g1~~TRINITY_DN4135_c0_g1_i1.p1  ORF type:complete len:664 (+),score=245.26 TRINITY_DN4135_c0_g1_i1:39-2030(+)
MAENNNNNDNLMFDVPENIKDKCLLNTIEKYKTMYEESINDVDSFWGRMARENLSWFNEFSSVYSGSLEIGNVNWFENGKLNVCYNCVDRHLKDNGDSVAIIWEQDEPDNAQKITYKQLHQRVCQISNLLLSLGVRKGDRVCIYLPMIPEAAYTMLACARIGAVHSVVFAGFSAEALRDRILDGGCKVVITSDEGKRGGRTVLWKQIVNNALKDEECSNMVKNVLVVKHTGGLSEEDFDSDRDLWMNDEADKQKPYCPCEWLDSEDPLFLLYTSGSTGKPKGLQHTQAGYLLYASLTHRYVFDYQPGDVYACVADVGWITGHSYIVYGPLSNGATTLMFESTPVYPDAGRYWRMVEEHKITSFYTAPTAIRLLMKYGNDFVTKYDRSSLRVLGTVGEPINPSAWLFYYNVVGEGKAAIVDTFWQTETGGHVLLTIPGVHSTKPGAAGFPFFGIKPVLLDQLTGEESNERGVLCISQAWPSMARTIHNDHQRYLNTYMNPYPGNYFTGDGAHKDEDGYIWIEGRVDDVINVSGHRLGTAEIESAFVAHPKCSEAAVIAVPHDIKGTAIFAYCCLNLGETASDELKTELKNIVREKIGPIATPDHIVMVNGFPKTRSGKIMRRIMRKIATNEFESLGDISTLADSEIVYHIKDEVQKQVFNITKK